MDSKMEEVRKPTYADALFSWSEVLVPDDPGFGLDLLKI